MKCDHDRGNQYTGGKDDNVMPANQGNSRSYTVSRLQREVWRQPVLRPGVDAKNGAAPF
jgi:hypothetical protein